MASRTDSLSRHAIPAGAAAGMPALRDGTGASPPAFLRQHATPLAQPRNSSNAAAPATRREGASPGTWVARERLEELCSALELCTEPRTLGFATFIQAMHLLRARDDLLQPPLHSLDSLSLALHRRLHTCLAQALCTVVSHRGQLGLDEREVDDVQPIIDGLGTAIHCARRMSPDESAKINLREALGQLTLGLLQHMSASDLMRCKPGSLLSLLNWLSRCWNGGIIAGSHAQAGALFRILMQRICAWTSSDITTKQLAKCFVQIRTVTSLELVIPDSDAGREVGLALSHLCKPAFLGKLSGLHGVDYANNPVEIIPICIDNIASSLARAVERNYLTAQAPAVLLALEKLVEAVRNFVERHGAGRYDKLPALLDLMHIMLATDPDACSGKAMHDAHSLIQSLLVTAGYAPRLREWKRDDFRKLSECVLLHKHALTSKGEQQPMLVCVGTVSPAALAYAPVVASVRHATAPAQAHELTKGQRKHGTSKERSAQLTQWIAQLNAVSLAQAKQLVRKFGFPALFEQPKRQASALVELFKAGEKSRKLLAWIASESGFHQFTRHNRRIVTRVVEDIAREASTQWHLFPEFLASMRDDFDAGQKLHQTLASMLVIIREQRGLPGTELHARSDPELDELRRAADPWYGDDDADQHWVQDDTEAANAEGNSSSLSSPAALSYHEPCVPGEEGRWVERLMQLDLRHPRELREFFWRVRRAPERLDADLRALIIEINARLYFPVESLRDDRNARASFIALRGWIKRAVSERIHARFFTPQYLAARLKAVEALENEPAKALNDLVARQQHQSRQLSRDRSLALLTGVMFAALYQMYTAAEKAAAADHWQLLIPGGPSELAWLDSAAATLRDLVHDDKERQLQAMLDGLRSMWSDSRAMLQPADVRRINQSFAEDNTSLLLSMLFTFAVAMFWFRQYCQRN